MAAWREKNRPVCLEKRFEFETYEATRDFLDRLGNYSEREKRFPDISFGKTYVNITLRPGSDLEVVKLGEEDYSFAREIDKLYE